MRIWHHVYITSLKVIGRQETAKVSEDSRETQGTPQSLSRSTRLGLINVGIHSTPSSSKPEVDSLGGHLAATSHYPSRRVQ